MLRVRRFRLRIMSNTRPCTDRQTDTDRPKALLREHHRQCRGEARTVPAHSWSSQTPTSAHSQAIRRRLRIQWARSKQHPIVLPVHPPCVPANPTECLHERWDADRGSRNDVHAVVELPDVIADALPSNARVRLRPRRADARSDHAEDETRLEKQEGNG